MINRNGLDKNLEESKEIFESLPDAEQEYIIDVINSLLNTDVFPSEYSEILRSQSVADLKDVIQNRLKSLDMKSRCLALRYAAHVSKKVYVEKFLKFLFEIDAEETEHSPKKL